MKRLLLRFSPEWGVVVLLALIVLLLSQAIHAPFQFPAPLTFFFMGAFYLFPFVVMGIWILLPLPFLIYRGKLKEATRRSLRQASYALCFCCVIILSLHIKLWAPLINPVTYDQFYETIDRNWFFWMDSLITWRGQIHSDQLDRLYFNLLTIMFTCSFIIHYLRGQREFRRVFLASILVQALGGLSYLLAPALGPFIYHVGANAYSTGMQHTFLLIHQDLVAGGTQWLQNNTSAYLVNGLGAMPSLHIAIAAVFLYYAHRYCTWLACFYWFIFLWIAFEAMASRWHYGIDLVFGLLLSTSCILLSNWWLSAHETAVAATTRKAPPKEETNSPEALITQG